MISSLLRSAISIQRVIKKEVKIVSEQTLNKILSEVQGLKSDVQGFKSEMQDMKSQMNNRFDTLETKMGSMETKLDSIHNHFAGTSEQLITISNPQSKREKILESLALRSLEQEADIRMLKRSQ